MAYEDPTATMEFVNPGWKVERDEHGNVTRRSVWRFRRTKDKNDEDAITRATVVYTTKFDPEARQKAWREGKSYTPEVDAKIQANTALCMMAHQSAGWEGPEFELPDWAIRKDGTKHPLAGGMANDKDPLDIDLVLRVPQLEEIERFLNMAYLEAERTEEQERQFRDRPGDVAGPNGRDGEHAGPSLAFVPAAASDS